MAKMLVDRRTVSGEERYAIIAQEYFTVADHEVVKTRDYVRGL